MKEYCKFYEEIKSINNNMKNYKIENVLKNYVNIKEYSK